MKHYPKIRHLTSYQALKSILDDGYLKPLIKNDILETWLDDRQKKELKKFGTNNLIFTTPDWYGDYSHETGHGPIMIYFNEKIFDDFEISFSISDNKISNGKIYNKIELKNIYYNIQNNIQNSISNIILNKYNIKNEAKKYNTSKGLQFIDSLFYKEYSEVQIHTKMIPISYIEKIIFTDIYLYKYDDDNELKIELKNTLTEKKIIFLDKNSKTY